MQLAVTGYMVKSTGIRTVQTLDVCESETFNHVATMQTLTRTSSLRTPSAAPAPALQIISAKTAIPRDRLLRLSDVQSLTGLGRSTIYEMGKKGNFPKSIKLSSRCAVWPESAVLQWVQDRIQGGSHA